MSEKELIERAGDAHRVQEALSFLDQLPDQKLSDFIREASSLSCSLEPDRAFTLSLIDSVSTNNKKDSENHSSLGRLRVQIRLVPVLRFIVPVVFVAIIGIVVFQHPFSREQQQVAELKMITANEKALSQSSSHIAPYFAEENIVSHVDGSIRDIALSESVSQYDPFDVSILDHEASGIVFVNDVATLLGSDASLRDIDVALSNF